MNRFIAIVVALLTFHVAVVSKEKEAQLKPRLVVCTDIASGDVEPDDMESMVRQMTYADCFEIEALITTVGWNHDPYPTECKEYLKRFVRKFRLFTITDQDMGYNNRMNLAYSSHMWLRQEFSDDLQFVWDEGAWQEQCELGKRHWQRHKDEIQGRGTLGKEYPTYKWGVEGDTPSFLYVMPHGLNNPDDPRQAGWAGYHERGNDPYSF